MIAEVPFSLALIDGMLSGASRVAPQVDAVFLALLLTCGAVAVAVGIFVLWFLIRYRRGSTAPRPTVGWPESRWEALWIGGTLVVFIAFYVWGARVYLRMETPPPNALAIDVVGRQWMWDVRHLNGRREFNAVHVAVNQPVLLRLSSEDVIHSFAVPAFRLKQDVVPGKTTTAWFEATRPGRYPIYCDQYCGSAHSEMNGEIVVETADEFARWQSGAIPVTPTKNRGAQLYVAYGCAGCHDSGTARRAPSLRGLAGNFVTLADGATVRADDAYLRESIEDAGAKQVAGYPAVMPSYASVLSAQDISVLVAYIRTLDAGEGRLAVTP